MTFNEFNIGYRSMAAMPAGAEKAVQYIASAMCQQGQMQHVVWCMERALESLGVDPGGVREKLMELGQEYEEGVPP